MRLPCLLPVCLSACLPSTARAAGMLSGAFRGACQAPKRARSPRFVPGMVTRGAGTSSADGGTGFVGLFPRISPNAVSGWQSKGNCLRRPSSMSSVAKRQEAENNNNNKLIIITRILVPFIPSCPDGRTKEDHPAQNGHSACAMGGTPTIASHSLTRRAAQLSYRRVAGSHLSHFFQACRPLRERGRENSTQPLRMVVRTFYFCLCSSVS